MFYVLSIPCIELYVLSVSVLCLPWAMAESCETPQQIKVLTLNCWAIPGGLPTLSSPHLKQRVAAIADFIISKQYSVVFLQVNTKTREFKVIGKPAQSQN